MNDDSAAPTLPAATEQPALPRALGQGRSLLLVDDDSLVRDLLESYFTKEGYRVRTALDGTEALHRLAEAPADIVLTDLCMPGTDGMELLMQLRRTHPQLPIVVMTGGVAGDMVGMLKAAKHLGAAQTLAKPFSLAELEVAMTAALAVKDASPR